MKWYQYIFIKILFTVPVFPPEKGLEHRKRR